MGTRRPRHLDVFVAASTHQLKSHSVYHVRKVFVQMSQKNGDMCWDEEKNNFTHELMHDNK